MRLFECDAGSGAIERARRKGKRKKCRPQNSAPRERASEKSMKKLKLKLSSLMYTLYRWGLDSTVLCVRSLVHTNKTLEDIF